MKPLSTTTTKVDTVNKHLIMNIENLDANDMWQRIGWIVAGFAQSLDTIQVYFYGSAIDSNGDEVYYDEEDQARVVRQIRGTLDVTTVWDEPGDPPARISLIPGDHTIRTTIIIPLREV
jgi:hypothetical protein